MTEARPPVFIHDSAEVEDGAVVGAGTKIWHLVHVRSSATIGAGCTIGRNVYIDSDVSIGDSVKIQNNVSVYRGVTIEDEVFVGPSAVFTNDLRPRAVAEDWKVTPTTVRAGASIGANATIVCGVTIGKHAMVAAGSVVTRDVLAHQLVAGNPARPRGWVNRGGDVVGRDARPPAAHLLTADQPAAGQATAGQATADQVAADQPTAVQGASRD